MSRVTDTVALDRVVADRGFPPRETLRNFFYFLLLLVNIEMIRYRYTGWASCLNIPLQLPFASSSTTTLYDKRGVVFSLLTLFFLLVIATDSGLFGFYDNEFP